MNSEDPKKPESVSIPELLDQALTAFDNTITQTKDLPIFPTDDIVIFPSAMVVMNVTDKMQIAAVERAIRESEHVIAMPVKQRANSRKVPYGELKTYYPVATQARVVKLSKIDDRGAFQITLQGEKRVGPVSIIHDKNGDILRATAIIIHETPLAIIGEAVYEDHTLLRTVRQAVHKFYENQFPKTENKEILRIVDQTRDAGTLSDFLATQMDMPFEQRAQLLCEPDVRKRLKLLLDIIARQFEVAKIITETAQKVRIEMDKQQRDYFIRQHIKALKGQIGEEEVEKDAIELKERIEKMDADQAVVDYTMKQWKRLSYMPQASAEYSVARAHIEVLLDIPWRKKTEDHINIHEARKILDEDHYGLEDVKRRVVEHLAVIALKNDLKAPILCLYGPPGVGKTSIGKSVARALNRKFERVSLGGIHDESEIRGHRRTYVASMPGRIVQALRHAQSMNPVIMLDEIDKLSNSMHGDPSSALLEVLDPEQNHAFVDNYVETPLDLSQVLFITTANSLDTVPGPLRDRMEIIEIHSYTHIDKREIATHFLIPKALKMHGLTKSNLSITQSALDKIISNYTHEAGVRQLEQKLNSICRRAAAHVVEAREEGKSKPRVSVTLKNLEEFLGKKKYEYDTVETSRMPGISTGLAWTPYGGDILFIESTDMPGKGEFSLTGQLGDVMKESVRAAMTLVRSRAEKLGIDQEIFKTRDVHVHFPAGATPKDGPSAGTAIFTALVSLFKNVPVPTHIAMTGEISLRGNVLPVGGIREKVLAAHRAGIKTILMPQRNERDLEEIPDSVKQDIEFHFVKTIDEVIKIVFGF